MSSLRGRVDTSQYQALRGRSARVGPVLQDSLVKHLRPVAQLSVKDVQTEVRKPPLRPSAHPIHRGLRERIAGSVKVQVTSGAKAGVAIVVGEGLPADQARLALLYDKPDGWKHPRFGDRDTLYQQTGRQYFATVIPRRRAAQAAAGRAVLADGAAALKGQTSP